MKKTLQKLNSLLAVFIVASMVSFAYGQITALPTMDGVDATGEWDVATEWPLEAIINTDSVADAADFSGTVKVMWSADSLYILCKVVDDVLYGSTTGNAYIYDNICVYIDAYNKATGSYVDSTQMYFEKNWWVADHMGGRLGPDWTTPPGNWGADTTVVDGYVLEIAYPWSEAAKTAAAGDVVGFDVKISDNDGPYPNLNRAQIAWSDVTDGGWNNPALWGEITLVADGSTTGMIDFVPMLDGVASDRAWAPAAATSLTSIISTVGVENAADLSGDFKLKWDDDYLYILSTVKDDLLYFGASDAYRYDNICVYVDAYNKKTDSYVDSTQIYYEKNWWVADHMGGRVGPDWKTPVGDWAADTALADDGMYVIEIAYPWVSADKTPAVGDIVGFDVKLSDNDGGDGEPRAQITYMDITDGGWNDPSLWGEVELLEGGFVAALSMRPAKPGGLSADVANDSVVTVSWNEVADAAGYNVYRDGAMVAEATTDLEFTETISQTEEDVTYVYMVRTVDADGVVSNASETEATIAALVIGIDHHVIGNVSVYPNPASEVLNIQSDEEITSVNIMSMSGQIVKTMSVDAFDTMIDISDVKSGIYIVNVKLNDFSQNYRIIVR